MSKERGVVLLMSLLLLGLLSALMVMQLEMLLLYQKSTQQWVLRQHQRHDLEQVAQQFIKRVEKNLSVHCLVRGASNPNDVLTALKTQTLDSGVCQIHSDEGDYRVILEDLGCRQSTGKQYSWRDGRVTVMGVQELHDYIQIRFFTKARMLPCSTDMKPFLVSVPAGIQSWRLGSV